MAFRGHAFDSPFVHTERRVGELGVIARFEIFVDQVRRHRIDALVCPDEIANAARAIFGGIAILAERAFVASAAAAIDIGFVLILHHVVARGHARGQTCIRAARVA